MAFADIARMYTNSTGTGDLVLTSAVPGFLTLSDAGIPDGVDFSYTILNGTSKRAVGRGTWDSVTKTFTRDPLEISSNNGTLGGLLDVQGTGTEVAVTFLARDIADLAGSNNSGAIQTTFLVSGGQVVWTTGLTFLVSAAVYYINGVAYASAQQNITLNAADGSNPRIDVIAVDTTGTVVKITGTAAASPSEPSVDPGSQLKLAIVTVAAAATEPTVTNTSIYAENAGGPTEWNGATSGTGYTLNSTADPRNGTTHVTALNLGASAYVQWDKPSGTIDPGTQNFLVFYIKSTTAWSSGRGLNVNLLSSGVVRGITIPINRQGSYGFNSLSLTSYQQIAIPLTHFAVPAGQTFNQVRFTRFGGAINFRMDDVGLQSGGAANNGGDFLTKVQADALYADRHVIMPQGRLTLTSGVPVLVTGVSGATSIYYTPFKGAYLPIFDGTKTVIKRFTELTNVTTDGTPNPAATVKESFYDLFVWDNSGTLTLSRGPRWAIAQTFTVTIASPAVFTLVGHGFFEGMSVIFTTTGTLPTGLTAGTTYYVINAGLTADAFRVSTTNGGSAVNTSGTQSGTHTATQHMSVRGTGAGTTELALNADGYHTNAAAITNGPAAERGTYVGTFSTDVNNQVGITFGGASAGGAGGESPAMGVWNAYNQVLFKFTSNDNSDSWTYTTAAWRAKNGNIANRVTFTIGLAQHAVAASTHIISQNSSANIVRWIGITQRSTSPADFDSPTQGNAAGANLFAVHSVTGRFWPTIGLNYLCAVEYSTASGTTTWTGDAAAPAVYRHNINAEIWG